MNTEVQPDAASVALAAARRLAAEARAAVAARGRFLVAVSGGQTPWQMLRGWADEDLPWAEVHVFQVDERVAPAGHADRNLTHIRAALATAPLDPGQIHAMPVEATDLRAAAAAYAATLTGLAGTPPVLDLVHLGLGSDGHTASLLPDDPVLEVADRDVAMTLPYQGRERMTLTYPLLNRTRKILWVATGAAKTPMVARLQAGDRTIPAGRVRPDVATLLLDRAAVGEAAAGEGAAG
jgi:6-phosphogluconolactonase